MLLVTLECVNILIWYLAMYVEDNKVEEAFIWGIIWHRLMSSVS
jgi:hypothetical protein